MFRPGIHAIMAHSHRNNRSIKLTVGLYNTGHRHLFTITEKVLCKNILRIGFVGSIVYIQIVEEKTLGCITFGINYRCITRRYGYHILAPFTIRSKTFEGVIRIFLLRNIIGIQIVAAACSRISLVILYCIEVVLVIEHPVSSGIPEFLAAAVNRDPTFVQ